MDQNAGDGDPGRGGERREALVALPRGAVAALAGALAPHGVSLSGAVRRTGELRLELGLEGGDAVLALVLPRRSGGEAFIRTRRFGLGYAGAERGDAATFAALRRLARALDDPEVAALVADELIDARGRPTGTGMRALREIEAGRGDLPAAPRGPLPDFDVRACGRGRLAPPRRLGPSHAVLLGPRGPIVHRARAEIAPGDALHGRKSVVGRARWFDGRRWRHLRLHGRCRACAARHACAGCFEVEDPDVARPDEATSRLRALLATGGAAVVIGTPAFRRWVEAAGGAPLDGEGPPSLVVEGARLTRRSGRARLSAAIASLGSSARVLVIGRSPDLLIGDAAGHPPPAGDPLNVAPAEAPRVARSLRGTVLSLREHRLPGRHDVDPWWLLYAPVPIAEATSPPIDLLLVANRKCVTVCRYCNLPLRLRRSTPLGDAWANIEEAAVLGAREMQFFGGEVTLRPELYALVAYGDRLGLACDLATTAVGLDEEGLRVLATCGVRDLSISIDAPDAEVHDDLKNREGMFEIAVAAARRLKALGAPWVGINTVVTPANFHLLDGVVRLAASLGLDNVTFFFCQPIAEIGNASPLLDEGQIRHLMDDVLPRCRALAEQTGVRVSVRPGIDREGGDREAVIARVGSGTYSRLFGRDDRCRHAETMVAIDPSGDVRLCTQPLPQFEAEMVVGNVHEAPLAEILVSERAVAFRLRAGHLDACRCCTLDHRLGDECLVGAGEVER